MSSVPPTLTELDWVVSQAWYTLCVPATGKNGIFAKVFYDEEVLLDIASDANLMFCPGLLDVVLSPTPPDIDFFKKLPVKYLGLWGVYCLVLEKSGCIPVIYIGEASNKTEGIPGRWRHYNNPELYRDMIPSKVLAFLDDGYKITHKAVLVYTPIPSAGNVPRFRCLFYVLEATFAFFFWAMFGVKDYQIASCCPWDRASLTYGGLCSHSSLNDPMKADLDLSPEELEQLAADAAEKQAQRHRDYYHTNKARNKLTKEIYCHVCGVAFERRSRLLEHNKTPGHLRCVKLAAEGVVEKFHCEPCDQGFPTFDALRSHQKTSAHMNVVMPPNETPVAQSLWCDICGTMCLTAKKLEAHKKSKYHLIRVEKLADGVKFNHRCKDCNRGFEDHDSLVAHKKTFTHKRNVELAAKAKAPPSVTPPDVEEEVKDDTKSGLHCDVCNQPCATAWEFARHNNSKKHLIRVSKIAAGVDFNKFYCNACNKGFADIWALKNHDKGQRHKAKVAELQEAEAEEEEY